MRVAMLKLKSVRVFEYCETRWIDNIPNDIILLHHTSGI